jgi:hypothetical protein
LIDPDSYFILQNDHSTFARFCQIAQPPRQWFPY